MTDTTRHRSQQACCQNLPNLALVRELLTFVRWLHDTRQTPKGWSFRTMLASGLCKLAVNEETALAVVWGMIVTVFPDNLGKW